MSSSPENVVDQFYVLSPDGYNNPDNQFFHSAPTSPIRRNLMGPYDPEADPGSPTAYHDAISDICDDDFEFETSRLFIDYNFKPTQKSREYEHQGILRERRAGSLPEMAFADELFCDGKVMPLKPPPRYQYGGSQSSSPVLYSPKSPTSMLKRPFHRTSLWNDDFDPFLTAIENVKGSNDIKSCCQSNNNHRRAQSVLPLPIEHRENEPQYSPTIQTPTRQDTNTASQKTEEHYPKSLINLPEPKGVVFARKARMVKMEGQDWSREPTIKSNGLPELIDDENEGSKRKRLKNFLFRSRSSRKSDDFDVQRQQTDDNMEHSKPKITRKPSLRSAKVVQSHEEKMGTEEVTQTTMVQYKPKRLLLCMGFGKNYVK